MSTSVFPPTAGVAVCTREEAIAGGVLVDALTGEFEEVTRRYFRVPVAMTAAVYGVIRYTVEHSRHRDDYGGIWRQVCSCLRTTISRQPAENCQPEIRFRVLFSGAARRGPWTFHSCKGSDEQGKPCLTILLPDEA